MKEIALQHDYLAGESIETIYFGGGTPSLLEEKDLAVLTKKLRETFNVLPSAEITLEANPDDIVSEKASMWQKIGINRLSIGVQSFFDEDLKRMNRAHSSQQSLQSIQFAQQAGIDNISIDLIYGSPGLSDKKWEENVKQAFSLNIRHLSCYALTVEPKTALHQQIENKISPPINTDDQARHFTQLMQWAGENGFEHYEISNFAKAGFRSRHNTSYWQQKKYLGLGPSAHSYNEVSRQWNVANNWLYIDSLREGKLSFEKEELSRQQQLNEYIMTGLRTIEGIDLSYLENKFGKPVHEKLVRNCDKFIRLGSIKITGEKIQLTEAGRFLADGIAADLFFDDL